MKTNYHTHTQRCNHAIDKDEQYVINAIQGGYNILGFSDHTPWNFKNNYTSPIRMLPNELSNYVGSIQHLRERYASEIEIKLGLECEYYIDHMNWLKEQKEAYSLDYLLFGNHYPYQEKNSFYFGFTQTHKELNLYLETSIQAIKSGLFECFAHPDLFMLSYPKVDNYTKSIFKELATACKEHNIVMERNVPIKFNKELWEVVSEVGTEVIVGMDAHKSIVLRYPDSYNSAIEDLKSIGINPISIL